ncbi:tyrosine-type recombinase/integrase [Ensifer aridi]|uniref:tyrosine-type recombinase/integrase n=1 Tax=Ensifer aridi TaxID=1708715 RepID=UPI000B05CC0E|nr:tyrosine-type recombinase/integrase [Ensifer aridi]
MLYCRLAAIRSFFNFVATKDPTSIAQCVEILNIPIKRAPVSEPCYLDPPEVAAILAQPDRSSLEGMRDHALFSFLYNSCARIQEALDVCPAAVRFDSPSCVRLTGKGRKERICPPWPETVILLKKLLDRQPRAPDQRLFVNRYGEPLSLVSIHKQHGLILFDESQFCAGKARRFLVSWIMPLIPSPCHRRSRQCAKNAPSKPAYSIFSPRTRSAAN